LLSETFFGIVKFKSSLSCMIEIRGTVLEGNPAKSIKSHE
jgi:hypothetical protein